MASNDDILRALGRIEGVISGIQDSISHLRSDFGDEQDHAHESRATIHSRLDAQQSQISKIETTIAIAGQVEAQLRNQVAGVKKAIDEDVTPVLNEWRRIKILGAGFGGLLVALGISIGAVAAWAGDAAVTLLRHWLRIN